MPRRSEIDLEKVKASLSTQCPHRDHQVTPAEIRRVSTDQVRCPKCGATFIPEKLKG